MHFEHDLLKAAKEMVRNSLWDFGLRNVGRKQIRFGHRVDTFTLEQLASRYVQRNRKKVIYAASMELG